MRHFVISCFEIGLSVELLGVNTSCQQHYMNTIINGLKGTLN